MRSNDNGWVRLALASGLVLLAAGLADGSRLSARPEAQRPLPPGGQAQLESQARESADALAATARKWVGTMHPDAQQAFRKWTLAVQSWKKEAPGPGAALAEGVLLDCLDRTQYLATDFTWGSGADRRFQDLARPDRLGRAAKLFDTAIKGDPDLVEARFRVARIRALMAAKAVGELEVVATAQSNSDLSYLAAVTRAAIAHDRNEVPAAIRWYEHALRLRPGSTAAAVGLNALRPTGPVPFESLDPMDPYYTYPCRILTKSIEAELTKRIETLPPK